MAIEVVKDARAGFGAQRLIIRGRSYLDLPLAVELRPRYNEYPERFPVDPLFPQPGRRKGSRAPSATGVPEGVLTEGEGAPVGVRPGVGVEPVSVYPVPRPRVADIPTSSLPSASSPEASSILACAAEGGIHLQVAQLVAIGATDRKISTQMSRPFIIRYVSFWAGLTDVNTSRVEVHIVNSNDVSAGSDNLGPQLDEGAIGLADFGVVNSIQQSFPNKIIRSVPAFIKVIVVNGTGALLAYQFILNLEWID